MWLKIDADSMRRRYKVSWAGRRFYPHALSVDEASIRKHSRITRNLLASLSDWSQQSDPAERHRRLVELAEAGSKLRYHLFNSLDDRDKIKGLEAWIADLYRSGDRELSIYADSTIQIPWGLIYDGDPPSADLDVQDDSGTQTLAGREIARFEGFWALKYNLSAMQDGTTLPPSSMTRARASFGLLSLLNEDVKKQLEEDLGHDDYRRFWELLSAPVGVAYDKKHCEELMKTKQRDILFHFMGHHNNATLYLADGQKIDYDDFLILMDSLQNDGGDPSRCGLLFLNGCDSAVGDDDINFRSLLTRPEICGIVATEASVRRTYAARFGYRFLRSMLDEGKTVVQTMAELYHDPGLWPESLLYGCYAQPDYRIEKAASI